MAEDWGELIKRSNRSLKEGMSPIWVLLPLLLSSVAGCGMVMEDQSLQGKKIEVGWSQEEEPPREIGTADHYYHCSLLATAPCYHGYVFAYVPSLLTLV